LQETSDEEEGTADDTDDGKAQYSGQQHNSSKQQGIIKVSPGKLYISISMQFSCTEQS
jgi:hypothetical protein